MPRSLPPVTARQEEVLEFIMKYQKEFHESPSMNDIAKHFGRSRTRANQLVHMLYKKGKLQKTENGRIAFLPS